MRKIVNWCDAVKPSNSQSFEGVESVTEQRAILNSPEMVANEFLVPDGIMDELESEQLADFDNDIHDYDERVEYGEDVALARSLPPVKTKRS